MNVNYNTINGTLKFLPPIEKLSEPVGKEVKALEKTLYQTKTAIHRGNWNSDSKCDIMMRIKRQCDKIASAIIEDSFTPENIKHAAMVFVCSARHLFGMK